MLNCMSVARKIKVKEAYRGEQNNTSAIIATAGKDG